MTSSELNEIVERNTKKYIENVESCIGNRMPKKDEEDLEGLIKISTLYKKNIIEKPILKNGQKEIFLILILLLSFGNFVYNCVKEKRHTLS